VSNEKKIFQVAHEKQEYKEALEPGRKRTYKFDLASVAKTLLGTKAFFSEIEAHDDIGNKYSTAITDDIRDLLLRQNIKAWEYISKPSVPMAGGVRPIMEEYEKQKRYFGG
jgi:hypothetical protein